MAGFGGALTRLFWGIGAIVALLAACGEDPVPPPATVTPPPAGVPPAAPASTSGPAGPRIENRQTSRLAASHVLVAYAGAVNAPSGVTRNQDEARARAEDARRRLLAGDDFATVARAMSDDSTGPRGGSLGSFEPGTMVEPFEAALTRLQVGELSPVVETPFGYHVVRRDALAEIHAADLYVGWAGADRAPAGITRTQDVARARAAEALTALDGGQDWARVVARYSDGPLKEDAGDLGWFGRNQLAPALDAAAFDLDIGAHSDVIETPRGYHILKRIE